MHDGKTTMRRELWRLLEENDKLKKEREETKIMLRQALDLVRELRKEQKK